MSAPSSRLGQTAEHGVHCLSMRGQHPGLGCSCWDRSSDGHAVQLCLGLLSWKDMAVVISVGKTCYQHSLLAKPLRNADLHKLQDLSADGDRGCLLCVKWFPRHACVVWNRYRMADNLSSH